MELQPYYASGADSGGRCNELGELLAGCHSAEGLSRSFVEQSGDFVEFGLGMDREV